MRKHLLLSGAAAFAVLGLSPAVASAQDVELNARGEIFYLNALAHLHGQAHLNASLTGILGGVGLEGTIDADSSAQAYVDTKQVVTGNQVRFKEETFREGRSGGVDPATWGWVVDDDPDELTNRIPIGYFAPIVNTVAPVNVSGAGNLGLNIAAGYYNAQDNSSAMAVSGFAGSEIDDGVSSGGWSEASLLALQLATNNYYGPFESPERDADDGPLEGPGFDDYRDRNTVTVASITGDGNIGVNAAAGAFNIQANSLVMAVSEDTILAKATGAVIQTAFSNDVVAMNSINLVTPGAISGSGNIGVNLAAGVGNMQHNSLTIATAAGGAN